jgi:ribosomal protein S18 acetylase RimI-like enzyme
MSDVIVKVGLPDRLRSEAASLYYEAFRLKTNFLFGSRERAIVLLQGDWAAEQALIAVQDDRLVGLAGIQHGRPFINVRFKTYARVFSWFTALWRYALGIMLHRKARPGELVMDGIAVDEAVRGQGVGTKLLNGVIEFAREHGYQTVRLDVVDTNPRARQLYERVGFVATETHRHPQAQRVMGFSASTTMIKQVN